MAKINFIALTLLLAAAGAGAFAQTGTPRTQAFSVLSGGKVVGNLIATTTGERTRIDFDVKNNGRGPTMTETIITGPDALPVDWSIKGATTFGSKVDEHFSQSASRAEWVDSTGKGEAALAAPGLYVTQSGSPWSDGLYARVLLARPGLESPVLPSSITPARSTRNSA